MPAIDAEPPEEWLVLVNAEEQYALWPAASAIPAGWNVVLPRGPKAAARAFVDLTWTEQRPKSLRSES